MKKSLYILFFSFFLAGELEVDGNLKVQGTIDAQNNPITNVGIPQTLNDAINGNVLQDALRDDRVYEYLAYKIRVFTDNNLGFEWILLNGTPGYAEWSNDFISELNIKALEGYEIHKMMHLPYYLNGSHSPLNYESVSLIILKRPIQTDE